MGKIDARRPVAGADAAGLYTTAGSRKYVNASERRRVLTAAEALPEHQTLFILTLAWSGARPSEILQLRPSSFQLEAGLVAIRTLKRRRHAMRELPLPPELLHRLDQHFSLSARGEDTCLWPWSRTTAWRLVKRLMRAEGIVGAPACPRGLRHGFGVGTLQAGVPLPLTARWMGHAKLSTTAIYANAVGEEERGFAARFWLTAA